MGSCRELWDCDWKSVLFKHKDEFVILKACNVKAPSSRDVYIGGSTFSVMAGRPPRKWMSQTEIKPLFLSFLSHSLAPLRERSITSSL